VMEKGRIAQIGPPRDVYMRPATRFVASFLGEASFVPAEVRGRAPGTVQVDGLLGPLSVPDPGLPADARAVTLVVRPEVVKLFDKTSALRGTVRSAVYLGGSAHYEVAVNGVTLSSRVSNPVHEAIFPEGSEVPVSLDARAVHALAQPEGAR